MNIKKITSVFLILALSFMGTRNVLAQNKRLTDSLTSLLSHQKQDTSRAKTLITLANIYSYADPDTAFIINTQALDLSNKLRYIKGIHNAYNVFGQIMMIKGNPDSSIYYHTLSLNEVKPLKLKKYISISLGNIGTGYLNKGDLEKALSNLLEASGIAEDLNDSALIAGYCNNIGLIYKETGDFDKALGYFKRSYEIKKIKGDTKSQANTIMNIGMVHALKGETEQAIQHYEMALAKFIETGYLRGQSMCYNNLGMTFYSINIDKAIEMNLRSLEIKERIGDMAGMCSSYINLGSDYRMKGDHNKALAYHLKGFEIAKELGLHSEMITLLQGLSKDYERKNDFRSALQYERALSSLKDTVLNIKKMEQLTEMQTKYDSEKKDKELIKKNAELKEKELESKHRATQRNAFVLGFILVFILMIFVFKSYRQKRRANIEINQQKNIIEDQKVLVEQKNREVMASIQYAQRIQKAHLPPEKLIAKMLARLK